MLSFQVESGAGAARCAYWNQAMREVYGPRWSLHPARPEDFHLSLHAQQIGAITLSRATLSQAEVSTTARIGRRSTARSYNLYIADRPQRLTLGGQHILLEPGDFMLTDAACSWSIVTAEPYTTIGLTVPSVLMRAYVSSPERVVGLRFSGSNPISRVVPTMLRNMWSIAEQDSLAHVGHRLVVSLLEVFSVCCDLTPSARAMTAPKATAWRAEIRRVVQENLHDPDFSVHSVGRALGLSTRYVQLVFNDGDESLSQYICRQRLEGCRRELSDTTAREHSLTAIAFRWGFNSAAHFSRAFRARFGLSPSAFRDQARHACE